MSTANQGDLWTCIAAATQSGNSREELANIYDKWAADYDKSMGSLYKGAEMSAQSVALLLGENKDALILDAGAGSGLVGEELQKLGFKNLDALDGSQGMLDVANEKGVYKRSICDWLGPNRLDIDSDHYDCVVCVGTVAKGNANASCHPELIRITKPGGYIVIATREIHIPNCGYDGKSWDDWLKIHEDNGLWKKVDVQKKDGYFADIHTGIIYMYRVL